MACGGSIRRRSRNRTFGVAHEHTPMRLIAAFLLLLASLTASLAADIHVGAMMQVRDMSVWFKQDAQLAQWQAKRNGNAKAFGAYQEKILRARDAWQFINPTDVEIL